MAEFPFANQQARARVSSLGTGRTVALLPGPSRRLAPVIKCSPFLSFFQRYIVRDIPLTWDIVGSLLLGVLAGSLKYFIRHFEKHEAWRTVNRETIAFWGTTRSPAFTMHEFMSENLRVNIWRDNFRSDNLRMNLPSRNLSRILRATYQSYWVNC